MMRVVALLLLWLSGACATEQNAAAPSSPQRFTEQRISGNGFSIAVPPGFTRSANENPRGDDLTLVPVEKDRLFALMVRGPWFHPGPLDEERCEKVGEPMKHIDATRDGFELRTVELPQGPGCFFRGVQDVGTTKLISDLSVVPTKHGTYVVGGSFDARDKNGRRLIAEFTSTFEVADTAFIYGHGFRAPIPDGFSPASDDLAGPGGAAVTQIANSKDDLLGSVIIIPLSGFSLDAVDQSSCTQFGDKVSMLAMDQFTFVGSTPSTIASRPVCRARFSQLNDGPARLDVFPFRVGPLWLVVQCTHEDGDGSALKACEQAVAGLELKG